MRWRHTACSAQPGISTFLSVPTLDTRRVLAAQRAIGVPVDDHGLAPEDLAKPGVVYQVGIPPRRIDILTRIDGVDFDRAWEERMDVVIDGLPISVLGRATLIANKRASGREKDREDVGLLEQKPACKRRGTRAPLPVSSFTRPRLWRPDSPTNVRLYLVERLASRTS